MMIIVKNEIFCIKNITLSLGFSVNCCWNQRCNHIEFFFFFFFWQDYFLDSSVSFIKWYIMPGYLSFGMSEPLIFKARDCKWGYFSYLWNALKTRDFLIFTLWLSTVYFLQKRQDKCRVFFFFSFNYLLQNKELISQHLQKGIH